MMPSEKAETTPLGRSLQHWRRIRKVSQLKLALEADISARHLSSIETGKTQPSREVVLQLASALDLSLRQRNSLLISAGYAPEYHAPNLHDSRMDIVRYAVERILKQHEPFPALVVNQCYDILMVNQGFRDTLSLFVSPDTVDKYRNVYRLVFADDGLQPFISDWSMVSSFFAVPLAGRSAGDPKQSSEELAGRIT